MAKRPAAQRHLGGEGEWGAAHAPPLKGGRRCWRRGVAAAGHGSVWRLRLPASRGDTSAAGGMSLDRLSLKIVLLGEGELLRLPPSRARPSRLRRSDRVRMAIAVIPSPRLGSR